MKDLLFLHSVYGMGSFIAWYENRFVIRFEGNLDLELPVDELTVYDKKKKEILFDPDRYKKTKVIKDKIIISLGNRKRSFQLESNKSNKETSETKFLKAIP